MSSSPPLVLVEKGASAVRSPAAPLLATAEPWAQPVVFDGCLGYLHPAGGDVGVLVCGAWGYEALCAYRTMAEFAETLARSGYPTLRFDYPGVGNSRGDLAGRSLDDWIASVSSAADALRRHSGARRIVLAGLGFGCLVALAAAKAGFDAAGFILLAPPLSGRRYLRETSAFAAMVASPHDGSDTVEQGAVSIAGFVLPASFAAQARALDPTTFAPPPPVFTILAPMQDRDVQPLVDSLGAKGAPVQQIVFEGYAELLAAPITTPPPAAAFRSIAAALERACPTRAPAEAPPRQWPAATLMDGEIVEEALRFGDGGRLFGVICRPRALRDGTPAVVIVNVGRNAHIGWRRMSVDAARALARKGIVALRFDLGGIGESVEREGQPGQILYSDWPQLEVTEAIDLLRARNVGPVTLAGVCSGAYIALQGAIADGRVSGLVAVNLYRMVWNPADSVEQALRFSNRAIAAAVTRMFTRERLSKIFSGEIDPRPGLRHLFERVTRRLGVAAMQYFGRVGPRGALYSECMRRFGVLRERNVRTVLGYSAGDDGYGEIDAYFGKDGRRLSAFPNVRVAVIEDCDHNLTPPRAGAWLLAQIEDVVAQTTKA